MSNLSDTLITFTQKRVIFDFKLQNIVIFLSIVSYYAKDSISHNYNTGLYISQDLYIVVSSIRQKCQRQQTGMMMIAFLQLN